MHQLLLASALALLGPAVAPADEGLSTAERPAEPVALVCLLDGEATVTAEGETRPARLFDRLSSGTVVETGPSSTLELAFANGRRHQLEARSQARVADGALEAPEGTVTELARFPEIVNLPSLMGTGAHERAGATRVRSSGIGQREALALHPGGGAVVLTGNAVLRFTAVEGVGRYRVELEDDAGRELLAVETETNQVSVSRGVLGYGRSYYWRVTTLDGRRPALRADAVFTTLGERETVAREALARRAAADQDPGLRLLQLEIDRRLGLRQQACEGLATAGSDLGAVRAREWEAELQCP